jgi:hypothetical protein
MKNIHWAEELATRPEIDGGLNWPGLARYLYRDKPDGGVHARWEPEDGYAARGTGLFFVHPLTGAVSAGATAEKEAAAYQASLIPPVESASIYRGPTIFVDPNTKAVSANGAALLEYETHKQLLLAQAASTLGATASFQEVRIS